MFEKLGVVTNSWARSMEKSVRFEDLVVLFVSNGFRHIEVRDGDYLRQSEFGRLIKEIERFSSSYSHKGWLKICDLLPDTRRLEGIVKKEHLSIFNYFAGFFQSSEGAVFSYAISHPWLTRPKDIMAENDHIRRAIKLAYLLCPRQARLRMVDLGPIETVNSQTAVANLKRYGALLPEYPVTLAVENSLLPAPRIVELAAAGGVGLAYDEANNYLHNGTALNTPETFWQTVRLENLASVHLKQKTGEGVLSCLGQGFVDIPALVERLRDCGYSGDLLLEYLPGDHPLQDAIQSRTYLMGC
jgi:sugar phosphate isomerase/epimerase